MMHLPVAWQVRYVYVGIRSVLPVSARDFLPFRFMATRNCLEINYCNALYAGISFEDDICLLIVEDDAFGFDL